MLLQELFWTPRKYYVFDVTSFGQRWLPWTCNSVKIEIKFHLECKLYIPCAQLVLRLPMRDRTYLKVSRLSIESWLMKLWRSNMSPIRQPTFYKSAIDGISPNPALKAIHFRFRSIYFERIRKSLGVLRLKEDPLPASAPCCDQRPQISRPFRTAERNKLFKGNFRV